VNINAARLNVSPNGGTVGTSKVAALNISNNGTLNIGNNKFVVSGGNIGTASGNGTYSGFTGLIQRGYNFGAWDGDGILTNFADAQSGLTTVAIATAEQTGFAGGTFSGVSVAAGDILMMYTYAGDANLDGTIDGGDYGVIDNFVQVPGAFGYANGDFNFDGVIDGGDYGIIDNNVQAQGAPFSTSGVVMTDVTVVPEPAGATVVAIAVIALSPLRRRRSGRRVGRHV
jgi:hypothetical protein